MVGCKEILCCSVLFGLVAAQTGPTNLRAKSVNELKAFAKIVVWWDSGSCAYANPHYEVFIAEKGGDATLAGRTQYTSLLIEGKNFWTNYTITLEAGSPCPRDKLSIDLNTGPGKPQEAKTFMVHANNTAVTWAVQLQPEDEYLHNYLISFQADSHIVNWAWMEEHIVLNHTWFNRTMPSRLVPNTYYEVEYYSTWLYEGEIYLSPRSKMNLKTDFFGFPAPANFTDEGSVKTVNSTDVTVKFQLDESSLTEPVPPHILLGFFKIALLCANGFHSDIRTEQPQVVFQNLPPGLACKISVIPVYQVKFKTVEIHNSLGKHSFTTPVTGPYNLTGQLGQSTNGFVDVDLHWEHGSCRGIYKVYTSENGGAQRLAATTRENSVTVKNNEYFSDYSFEVENGEPCPVASQKKLISTGNGKPHRIEDLIVDLKGTSISFSIAEASTMPRVPDTYVFHLESILNKSSFRKPRDSKNIANGIDPKQVGLQWFNFTAENILKPKTHYRVGVAPVISRDGLEGEMLYREFDTDE